MASMHVRSYTCLLLCLQALSTYIADAVGIFGEGWIHSRLQEDGSPPKDILQRTLNWLHTSSKVLLPLVKVDKHTGKGLRETLNNMFGNDTLDDVHGTVVVPAYDTAKRSPVVFYRCADWLQH